MNGAAAEVTVAGETLLLHHERAVIWPARRTVIVADTHFGKSAVFGRHGVAVPAGSDEIDRERLTRLLQVTQATRLLVLGDFVHAPLDSHAAEARMLAAWCASLAAIEIRIVAGNHDRTSAPPGCASLNWQRGDLIEPPFRFTHDAERGGVARASGLFTLSGHIHPVARLMGLRKRAARVPIFWQRPGGLVLPSFGIFTGGYVVAPADGDAVFAVGPERVVRFR
jgi:DNA ligase-associated metallophosphoesterase